MKFVHTFHFSLIFCVNAITYENNACTKLDSYPVKDISSDCFYNPNVLATTPIMILQDGYEVFTYYVVTPDGYVLEIFRIPPKEDDNRKNKQPVVLEHGIFVDSGTWVFTGNKSLAITLASMGYDVWLSNQRGTRYSRTHKTLNSAGYDYWLYSIDQVAANDIPTILEKVALETKKSGSIIYIGHSRGTTLIFMYASTFPEKTQKLLKGIVALSPIAYLDLVWYLKLLGKLGPLIGNILLKLGLPVINRYAEITINLLQHICRWVPRLCKFAATLGSGRSNHLSPEDLLAFFSLYPYSIAVMQLIQYAQMYKAGKVQKYDYGLKNQEIYQQATPPLYDLSKIKTPVYMFYGKHDILFKTKHVEKLYNELGSEKKNFTSIPTFTDEDDEQFGHNDFIWTKDLDKYFYKDLFAVLETELST
ncbi:gastric triacylglycerol lipase-like [Tribolium castaneum]|uniref:gastric triacylglycerol lipase-like n=1 Tax=Tribolium castaneum TaxID=7070 RepID=UPI00077DB241|nr:PREDICTED: gastric triacylglycerol lipase-like [Tribolium castaneum]|eukprot:XP_015838585.1 PREDICTED: gastric triacylglycerol lipase-like [Tribolium castaneum]